MRTQRETDLEDEVEHLQARVKVLEGAIRECIRADDSYYNVTSELAAALEVAK